MNFYKECIEDDGEVFIPNFQTNNHILGEIKVLFLYAEKIDDIEPYQELCYDSYLKNIDIININTVESINMYIENNDLCDVTFEINTLVIRFDFEDGIRRIGFLGECSWEVEHGLGVLIENEEVIKVGFQDIVI